MDLSSLYTSLEPGQLAQAERQMMENFRGASSSSSSSSREKQRSGDDENTDVIRGRITAAALSITTLYKSSLNTSKVRAGERAAQGEEI